MRAIFFCAQEPSLVRAPGTPLDREILTKMSAWRRGPQVSIFRHRGQILPWPDHLEARPISCKPFKSMQLTHIIMGKSCGGRIALQTGIAAGKDNRSMAHSESKEPE
jgi:hypothetical protein